MANNIRDPAAEAVVVRLVQQILKQDMVVTADLV
jgi:uncharacterized protein YaiI (UPF0178 family)